VALLLDDHHGRRDLQPFPTRRSSDLRQRDPDPALTTTDLHRSRGATMSSATGKGLYLGIDIGGSGIKGAPVDLDKGEFASERKRSEETRLNSSHVKISYAVFCLKKKK